MAQKKKGEKHTESPYTHIPSREDFHKGYAGEITWADYNTNHPNPFRMRQFNSADKFNARVKRQEDYTFGK